MTAHDCRPLWVASGVIATCSQHYGQPVGITAGDIGPVRRRVDLEPMPEAVPIQEPSPVVVPERQPVPVRTAVAA
ncbi:MAG: hypothetical protein JWO67_5156 [Streptosporangiaceae bacterium]|nr:hypothetical protein [Streptosporangiaceae bacterium]